MGTPQIISTTLCRAKKRFWPKIYNSQGYKIKVKVCSAFSQSALVGPREAMALGKKKNGFKSFTIQEENTNDAFNEKQGPGFCLFTLPSVITISLPWLCHYFDYSSSPSLWYSHVVVRYSDGLWAEFWVFNLLPETWFVFSPKAVRDLTGGIVQQITKSSTNVDLQFAKLWVKAFSALQVSHLGSSY